MNILCVNTSPGWGGMEMHPLVVADSLGRRGHNVFFAMRRGTPMEERARGLSFTAICLPFRWYLDPWSYPVVRQAVRSAGIDVVHVHASQDVWRSLLLAGLRRRRAAVVVSRHLASPAGRKKDDLLHRAMTRRIDAMVAISPYIAENIRDTYVVDPRKVKVIPYGLGQDVVGDAVQAREIRREMGVPAGGFLVGMVAQVTPDKRQDLFLRAAQRILRKRPQCRFVLAGGPVQNDYADQVNRIAEEPDLKGRVVLAGHRDDIPALMQALDVFVLPSKTEAFGLVLLEAMANGRPVAGSASGAVPQIVQHGESGLLFTPGCADSLAAAVDRLLGDESERARMGKTGQQLFLEKYSLEREVSETEILYQSLLG